MPRTTRTHRRPTLRDSSERTDRRSSRRAGIRDVTCTLEHEGEFITGQKVCDLSLHGALVETKLRLRTGMRARIRFTLPTPYRRELVVVARVARVIAGRRKGDPAHALGFIFEDIEDADAQRLALALARLPPPVPKRELPKDYVAAIRKADRESK